MPSFSLKPFPPHPITTGPWKNLSPSFLKAPFKYWKASVRCPWSLLFCRLNNRALLPCLQQRSSSPLIIFVASFGLVITGPCFSRAGNTSSGTDWTLDSRCSIKIPLICCYPSKWWLTCFLVSIGVLQVDTVAFILTLLPLYYTEIV